MASSLHVPSDVLELILEHVAAPIFDKPRRLLAPNDANDCAWFAEHVWPAQDALYRCSQVSKETHRLSIPLLFHHVRHFGTGSVDAPRGAGNGLLSRKALRRTEGWLASVTRAPDLLKLVRALSIGSCDEEADLIGTVTASMVHLQVVAVPWEWIIHRPDVVRAIRPVVLDLHASLDDSVEGVEQAAQGASDYLDQLFGHPFLSHLTALSLEVPMGDTLTLPWLVRLAPTLTSLQLDINGYTDPALVSAVVKHHGASLRRLRLAYEVDPRAPLSYPTLPPSLRATCPELTFFGFDVVPAWSMMGRPPSLVHLPAFLSQGHPKLATIELGGGGGGCTDEQARDMARSFMVSNLELALGYLHPLTLRDDDGGLPSLGTVHLAHVSFDRAPFRWMRPLELLSELGIELRDMDWREWGEAVG